MARKQPDMESSIDEQILREFRKLRKTAQWNSVIALLVLAGVCVLLLPKILPGPPTWYDVSSAMRQSDYQKALEIAARLTNEHNNDYYGHEYLGSIYLATGDVAHAEAEYSRAYELMPMDDIQRKLAAIRSRLQSEHASTAPKAKP